MRRVYGVAVAALLAIGLFSQAALAASPHFVKASAARQGSSLVVSFKEAGLGEGTTVTIQASASFTRTDSCVNKGGKVPSDPKKTVTQGTTSESGEFTADKNGNVVGSLTLTTSTTLQCPSGQRATLQSLSFTNVSVTDLDNNVSRSISGTF